MTDNAQEAVTQAPASTRAFPSRTPLYAAPAGASPRLRVVLVAPRKLPAWLLRFFDMAAENPWLDLVVMPIDGAPVPAPPAPPADLRVLLRYERRRTIASELARVAVASHDGVTIASAVDVDVKVAALRAQVSALGPDLVLVVDAPHWAESLGDRAPWGCWDFDPSLFDAGRATQALLGPVMRGDAATLIELRLQHLDRPPTTLSTCWAATCRSSASAQRERALRKVPVLLLRSLRQLALGGLHVPQLRTARLHMASAPAPEPVRWGDGIRAFARTLAFRCALKWRQSRPDNEAWHVLVRRGEQPVDPDAPDVRGHSYLSAPANHFWADPCLAEEEAGRGYLFVEQWTAGNGKGVIACLELLPDAQVANLGVVLDMPVHLSYPQAFRWAGQWYLTVESGHDNCVGLYRAEAFPFRWAPVAELVRGRNCVDPTLYRHDGHWYLFAAVDEGGGSTSDELFLFVAEELAGPFRPHPANPIVSDVRRARPAGRVFQRAGRLIRPAQDCAPRYGAAVVFNEVLELSPTHYRERPLGRLDSRWAAGLDGCHTYSESGGTEVLDVRGTPPAHSARHALLASPAADDRLRHGRVEACRPPVPGILKS